MCVEATRSALFSRASFLSAAAGAAAAVMAQPAGAEPSLRIPALLSGGNRRAAEIAAASPFIRKQYAAARALARSIGDARLRDSVQRLLDEPIPSYARRYHTEQERIALRDALAREGFVAKNAPVSGIFPPGTGGAHLVQPFWSAAGSDMRSHHSYPGGLTVHELFNATIASHFEQTYDRIYFDGASRVNRDLVIAAAFYHDIMKTVVFQFNDDGSLLPELEIGATGGHHCLSGAQAIVDGHDARFVTVLLSAHAAPSLGDEAKVVTWCRAAAMIAGVDPIEYGLVRKSVHGYVLAQRPVIETFVNHLSDHDYVLTIHAVRSVVPQLEALAPAYGRGRDRASRNWFRHEVLAKASAVALYGDLTRGEHVFRDAVHAALA